MEWQSLLLLTIVIMLVLLAAGVWIGIAIAAAGIVCLFISSKTLMFGGIALVNFNSVNSFVLTAVPLFLFMGGIIEHSGLSDRAYKGITTWIYWLPGGLVQSNIMACTVFAAICGSSVACAATIGTVAIPEMTKRGYDPKLLFGSLAAGGTLGILIPPSIPLIVYGAWTEQSVAELFMAGIVPGILLALVFVIYIVIRVRIQPRLVPKEAETSYSWNDRFKSLKDMVPIGFLILLVLGSIYLGWTTPTEAAALGACGACIIALAYGKLNFKSLEYSLMTAVRTTCMVLLIIIGAQIFSFGLTSATIPRSLVSWFLSFNVTPITFFIVITILYMILGCFIDGMCMMLMTLPIIYPLVLQLGFNPIWFGIYMVLQLELALITPPVGLNLFVIHGVSGGHPMSEVIKGALPYCFIMIFMMVLLALVPGIVLWLPQHMIRS